MSYRLAALIMLAAIGFAEAAPNIPPSELPGRERQRFLELPVDRFTQPDKKDTRPLWHWECDTDKTARGQKRGKKKGC